MFYLACLASVLMFQDTDLNIQERYQVEYVLLDVLVYDNNGNVVTDLELSDFVVTENKKKITVTYFDVLDYRSGAIPDLSDVPEDLREEVLAKSIQQIVLAIDAESLHELDTKKVFAQLRDFIRSLDESKEYRLNVFSMDRGSITKGFVHTPKDALAALNRLEDRHVANLARRRGGGDPSDSVLLGDTPGARRRSYGGRNREMRISMLGDRFKFSDLEKAFGQCRTLGSPQRVNSCINQTLEDFMEEQRQRKEAVIGQLELLTYDFENLEGLKTMLFVSPGFALNNMASAFELASLYKINTGDRSPFVDTGHNFLDTNADFRQVLHACIKNRVIFHTFDVLNRTEIMKREAGIETRGVPSSQVLRTYRDFAFDISDGLRSLAEESGGNYFQAARLKGVMNKTMERSRYFYVLGYDSPTGGKPGKFRKIKIKLKKKRKGVTLRYRKGYFGR